MQTLTRDQYWELFQKSPDELKEAILSENTANSILDTCDKNGLELDQTSVVAKYTGRVLLGILPPSEFKAAIEKDLELAEEKAKDISAQINRFVFYPVKNSLAEFYSDMITPQGAGQETKEEKELRASRIEKEIPAPSGKDTYREPIE